MDRDGGRGWERGGSEEREGEGEEEEGVREGGRVVRQEVVGEGVRGR